TVTMPGLRSAGFPGEPVLPIDNVVVAVPQHHRVVDIQVVPGRAVTADSGLLVAPAQPQVPLSMTGPWQPVMPDPEVYLLDADYPGVYVDHVKPLYCRGYRMVSFNLRPVQYHPSTGTLTWYESLTARVITEPEAGVRTDLVRCRGLESDREWAKRKVSNSWVIDTYVTEAAPAGSPLSGSRDNFPYVIVTSDDFQAHFATFLNHKQVHGYPGTIVTMTWVTGNYSGQDDAEKLRNFVIDAYNNWNLEFLLLGGDDDRSDVGGESGDVIVPSRDFFSDTDYYTSDDEIPADMYYACLDGTFNNDGDNLWAEPTDGPSGGEVDWFGEVHVGRACVDSEAEIQGFTDFVMIYENSNPDESWMTEAYMVGELLWSDPTYGGDYKDEIKFGSSMHGYTTAGFPPEWTVGTLYDRDLGYEWGESQLYAILNSDNVHVVNHLGHSNVDYCMRIYNSDVDNDLTNTVPWFGYSQGCYDGSFDDRDTYSTTSDDCICEHMTTQSLGPFAFVGNSRYGWGEHSSTNGSSQYYDRQFFDAIFGEEIVELGAANQDSKEDNVGFLDYGANRWCG
ncbi:MAG TPA: C25 family cysteine peptidase, partial [bacterium]|nr:C25 family cysteine peptidase [bacterium]